jgi:hypothetical protein
MQSEDRHFDLSHTHQTLAKLQKLIQESTSFHRNINEMNLIESTPIYVNLILESLKDHETLKQR